MVVCVPRIHLFDHHLKPEGGEDSCWTIIKPKVQDTTSIPTLKRRRTRGSSPVLFSVGSLYTLVEHKTEYSTVMDTKIGGIEMDEDALFDYFVL